MVEVDGWIDDVPGATPHLLEGEGHSSVLVGRYGAMLDELLPHL